VRGNLGRADTGDQDVSERVEVGSGRLQVRRGAAAESGLAACEGHGACRAPRRGSWDFVLENDSRDKIAEALRTDAHGDLRKHFRQTLWIIGSALQRHAGLPSVIRVDGGWIETPRAGLLRVDHWDLQRLTEPQDLDVAAAGSVSSLERAHMIDNLCDRRLLEGWSYPWVVGARDWARIRHLEALETIVHSYRQGSQHDRVLQYTARALQVDPSFEAFHRDRIRAYYELGDRAAAALAYRQCVDVLRSTYGLEPGAETVEWGQRALGKGATT